MHSLYDISTRVKNSSDVLCVHCCGEVRVAIMTTIMCFLTKSLYQRKSHYFSNGIYTFISITYTCIIVDTKYRESPYSTSRNVASSCLKTYNVVLHKFFNNNDSMQCSNTNTGSMLQKYSIMYTYRLTKN